jgi:hypothetical protein
MREFRGRMRWRYYRPRPIAFTITTLVSDFVPEVFRRDSALVICPGGRRLPCAGPRSGVGQPGGPPRCLRGRGAIPRQRLKRSAQLRNASGGPESQPACRGRPLPLSSGSRARRFELSNRGVNASGQRQWPEGRRRDNRSVAQSRRGQRAPTMRIPKRVSFGESVDTAGSGSTSPRWRYSTWSGSRPAGF